MAEPFNANYTFAKNNLVVLKHPKGAFLSVKSTDLNALDWIEQTTPFARWNIELHGQQDGLTVIKLKSPKTNAYLSIFNCPFKQNDPSCRAQSVGSKWSRFKVHKTGVNTAKLESCELPGIYLGPDFQEIEFAFFRQQGKVYAAESKVCVMYLCCCEHILYFL